MSVIYVLIPIAVLFVMIGLAIFFWAVRSKQFDDLDKQGFSILFDDERKQHQSPADIEQPTGKDQPKQEPDER